MQWIKDIINHNVDGRSLEEAKTWVNDVMSHGCASGSVNGLIWYQETSKIYEDNEIRIITYLEDNDVELKLQHETILTIMNDRVWCVFEMLVQPCFDEMVEDEELSFPEE